MGQLEGAVAAAAAALDFVGQLVEGAAAAAVPALDSAAAAVLALDWAAAAVQFALLEFGGLGAFRGHVGGLE